MTQVPFGTRLTERVTARRSQVVLGLDPDPRTSEWLSFVLILPIGFGVGFQLPLVMLFLARIGVFIKSGAVKGGQPVVIGGEMARHPIEQHSDASGMSGLDEIAEFVRRAEPDGGREQADRLVTP